MNEDTKNYANANKKPTSAERAAGETQFGGLYVRERPRRPSKLTLDIKAAARAASNSTPGTTPTGSGQFTPGTPGTPGNNVVLDLTWDQQDLKSVSAPPLEQRGQKEEEGTAATRGHGNPPPSRNLILNKVVGLLKELDRQTRAVRTISRENTNTKKEIEEGMTTIRSLMSQLMTKDVLDTIKAETTPVPVILPSDPKPAPPLPSPGKGATDAATQTETTGMTETHELDLERELREATTHLQFLKLAEKCWPEEAYRHTKIWEGDEPPDLDWQYDVAINVTEDLQPSKTVPYSLSRLYLNANEIDKQGVRKGGLATLRHRLETPAPQGGYNDHMRYVYLLINKDSKENFPEEEALRTTLRELRDAAETHQRRKIALFPEVKSNPREAWSSAEDYRKLLEWTLRGTTTEVTLVIPKAVRQARPQGPPQPGQEWKEAGKRRRRGGGNKSAATRPAPPKPTKTRRGGGDTLLVQPGEGKSYADMVTAVRRIDLDALGVELSSMRKTSKGDMLMVVKGDRNAAAPLKEHILSGMAEAKVTIRTDERTILISDLDAVATREEVMEAIQGVVEEQILREQITLKELRLKSRSPSADAINAGSRDTPEPDVRRKRIEAKRA